MTSILRDREHRKGGRAGGTCRGTCRPPRVSCNFPLTSRIFIVVRDEPEADRSGVHLWLVLMKAHRAMERRANASIRHLGLCFSDFSILEILLNKGPLPVNAIGARIPLTSGSATTAVDRLESRRLVRREVEPGDRRTRVVHLTPDGRRMIEDAFVQHSADIEAATAGLTEKERATAIRLLRKLGKSAEAKTTEGV